MIRQGMPARVSIESYYEDVDCLILVANASFQVPGLTDCCWTDS